MTKSISYHILILLVAMLLVACDMKFDNPLDPENKNPEAAIENVKKANKALEEKLFQLINTNINRPSDIDFSEPNTLYKLALEQDPNNLDANFGAGLTELLMITQDNEINTAFDRWKAFLDTASFFEVKADPNGLAGFDIGFPTNTSDFGIPQHAFHNSVLGFFKAAFEEPPRVSELQDLIDNELLPRLNYALSHLDIVDNDSSYQFIITPKMQGDMDEDSLEIDLTEIYALQVEGNIFKAFCEISTAYNCDFVSYDSVGILTAFSRGSDFMSLKSNGATKMSTAKTALLTAIDKLEAGINFLKNESDPQYNDIIKIGPDDADQADLDSILAHTPDIKQTLTESYTFTEDWDDDDNTPPEPLTINTGAQFDNPIQDFKEMLPAYTISVGRDTLWDYWDYGELTPLTVYYFPILIWEANSFQDWIFPDPTFNGILPGMTDSEFKRIFGITEQDWDKTWD